MTNPATPIIAQLEAMDVSDDLHEVWQATFDAMENLSIALDCEADNGPISNIAYNIAEDTALDAVRGL